MILAGRNRSTGGGGGAQRHGLFFSTKKPGGTSSTAIFCPPKNLGRTDEESNPDLRGDRPSTNHESHDAASIRFVLDMYV